MNLDGSNTEIFAHGVRNSVGFDWHPVTKRMWFSDNGRDHMGDDVPPDELNQASRSGLHFGYPHCHGADVADPEYGQDQPCKKYIPPELELGAHVAPLGLRFYTGMQFPVRYRKQLFLAEHGSWNRSRKAGYQVRLITIEGDRVVDNQVFASGWLQGQQSWGRPVDLAVMPDGALLISDDKAGVIYRISYPEP